MAQVKELYIGENLRDLEKYYDLPDYSSKKLTMLLSSARKLFQLAERSHLDGDEEQSYIQYMKYFNLVDCIRKMPDYKEHKKQVRQTLGGNGDLKITMDKLGILNKSLKKRYQRLAEKKKAAELISRPDYNHSHNLASSYDGTSDESDEPTDISKYSLMSCEDLYRQIRTSSSLLIMDCRSKTDFQNSRLHYPWCLNVPEEHIQHGMSAGKLQDRLDNNSKPLWSSRSIKDQVVLMDWNCHEANPPTNTPIATLRAILQDWDPDVTYKSPIKILQNGYEYFILMYPTLCTNPSVQAPRAKEKETDIEEIEYPNIHDITMKEDVAKDGDETRTMQRPSVDRSSKIAALKTYEQYQKPVVDILKEQELLAEKALDNGKQLLQAEHEWQTVTDQTAKTEQEDQKNVLLKTQQELYYNILQLEYTQKDLILENNRLRQELEESRRRDNEQIEVNKSPKEVQTIEETTKKIEDKIQEQQKLQEQHENEKRLRLDKQLALAREQKRRMKERTYEDEEMSKPKIPQFDRSIKPSVKTIERVRDFSPVSGTAGRGLTGLKNLGNTCYMNSILQCLSNTQPLTEYCITDKYKNNISRANKTSGHVVEEVAALFKVLWNGNYRCVASKDLRYVVGQYQQIFRGVEQQDSHEFLTILMDWLHSDLQTLQVHKPLRENMPASERAWLEFTKARESLILRLFYGQIKSTVKCVHCSKESATYECFSNLSLELPSSSNMCGLNQCMDMYFNGERIHGWICPNCKQPREAVKKLDISKLPPILVVHFKRFYADTDSVGHSYKKKLNYVTFPLENLDITPYIAKSELRSMSPKTYQLYGVSNHYGSMESGHYTAFCKSGVFGKWFKFDDQVVSPIDTSDVVSSAAYILFYTWLPQTPPPEIN